MLPGGLGSEPGPICSPSLPSIPSLALYLPLTPSLASLVASPPFPSLAPERAGYCSPTWIRFDDR
eukprot:7051421-Alexandrium_andersonii.AAC.1